MTPVEDNARKAANRRFALALALAATGLLASAILLVFFIHYAETHHLLPQ